MTTIDYFHGIVIRGAGVKPRVNRLALQCRSWWDSRVRAQSGETTNVRAQLVRGPYGPHFLALRSIAIKAICYYTTSRQGVFINSVVATSSATRLLNETCERRSPW